MFEDLTQSVILLFIHISTYEQNFHSKCQTLVKKTELALKEEEEEFIYIYIY